jgi:hypothetical protein
MELEIYNTITTEEFVMQPYLQAKSREIRKCIANFRTKSH